MHLVRIAVTAFTLAAFLFLASNSLAQEETLMPSHLIGDGPIHKVVVHSTDIASLEMLHRSSGVLRFEDYGAFRVYEIDEVSFGGRDAVLKSGLPIRDELDLVQANGWVLDGARIDASVAQIPAAWRLGAPGEAAPIDAGLFLVKFRGPIRDEWHARLEACGTKFVQYVPMNAYVVALDAEGVNRLDDLAAELDAIQFVTAWHPALRVTPALRQAAESGAGAPRPVTIQLVDGNDVRAAFEEVNRVAAKVRAAWRVGPYYNVKAEVDPFFLKELARNPRVFHIEELTERKRHDERQGQILAGNVSGGSPSAPGYLSWLAAQGFGAGQFTSFSVNVVDDCANLVGHPDLPSGRVAFENNPSSQSATEDGHGFLNAHIVGGFNNGTGAAVEDSGGYNYGLGIAPWAQVGVTGIFGPGNPSSSSWESTAYNQGARISTNSWGFIGAYSYNTSAQEYDFITRDARSSQGGNQEMTVLFAAGNDGPGSDTVSSPATAKNVICVGASENDRQTGTDGCAVSNSGANDWRDIIGFSSRGPVNTPSDNRVKPDIMAPGTHIQAGIPQSNYGGTSVCNAFWPTGQTLYGWSSGTSHSCPAVAGGAALVFQDFLNNGMSIPSPAMTKAVIMNHAKYMTGTGAGGSLPSNDQGMGLMDLDRTFDSASRILEDQTTVLGSTGATHTITGNVASGTSPFRVTLAWTDAPGTSTGTPYANNLDLQVTVGGNTYRGNVFSGASSTTGGSADIRNNVESVFLPAGVSGAFTITITATNIVADGVPGNGDSTDQDFAVVVYNGLTGGGPAAPVANFTASPTSGSFPLTVNFNDASTGTVSTYAWTFGDGGTSTAQSPTHTYTAAGTYTVALTVTGPGGSDTDTRVGFITVTPPPVPGISDGSFESQTAGSAPAGAWTTTGTGHVINPDGGTSADNGMPTDGANWADLAADSTDGATPPSNPGGTGSAPVGGAGISQDFSYPSGVTMLAFDAAFMRNEDPDQGTYNDFMSVDITDGSTTVNLYYADTFTATPNTSSKHGLPMTAVSNVMVDLAALFPSSTTSTNFTLTAIVGNGADDIQPSRGYVDDFQLFGAAPVAADFSANVTSGAAPLTVNFTDLSTGGPTSWLWAFGDGSTSTAQNPSRTYASAGTYSVSLVATGPGGSDTEFKLGYITVTEAPPTASFTSDTTSGTAPLTVNFTDTSTGSVTSWVWSFGDGATSTAQNPSHTYTTPGTYTVSLVATGPGGSDTDVQAGYVTVTDAAPTADFTADTTSGTAPLTVNFTDTSSGNVTSWLWAFGDGSTSTAQNPNHTYASAGTYSVSLVATGPGGSDTEFKFNLITVTDAPPVAAFTSDVTSGTAPLTVNFSDASTGNVTSWVWSFGDGATSTAQNPSHTYTTPGSYTVSLVATGPGGMDTDVQAGYVTVTDPAPTAGFSADATTGTAPLTVNFTDTSGGNVTSRLWAFGDGSTSTLQNPSHTYNSAGTYSVSLVVTGPGGSDTEFKLNYITVTDAPPVASFTSDTTSGTAPLTVNFTDTTTGNATSWSWSFGDGGTSTQQNPSYTYTTAGTFDVSLTATGPGGADTVTQVGYVTVSPLLDDVHYFSFDVATTLPGLGVVQDEDIVAYDELTGQWSMHFDGSDVGLSATDVDGFQVFADGSVMLSIDSPSFNLPGLFIGPNGTEVTHNDIILFAPTSTGTNTAGVFYFIFDGSDVGLDTASEAIDGLYFTGDFSVILLSTVGATNAQGLIADGNDMLVMLPAQFFPQTIGFWIQGIDGSDVGLETTNENLDAMHFDITGGTRFSTTGAYSAGAAGDRGDIARYIGVYGPNSAGTVSTQVNVQAFGVPTGTQVDGYSVIEN